MYVKIKKSKLKFFVKNFLKLFNYLLLASLITVSFFSHSHSSSISGSILASRFASSINDFDKSAEYTLNILKNGIRDSSYYNDALLYLVASGSFDSAFKLSKEMFDLGLRSPALSLVMIIEKVQKKEFEDSLLLISLFQDDLPPVLIYSLKGWINLYQDKLDTSLIEFNNLGSTDLKFDLGSYYSAIAYTKKAHNEKALKILMDKNTNFKVFGKIFEIFKYEVTTLSGDVEKANNALKISIDEYPNDITLKELYRNTKENWYENYQIFKNQFSGISDTLLLFARGESRQINQKLVELFYCQLAYFLNDKDARYKLRLAIALNDTGLFKEAEKLLNSISSSDLFYIESRLLLANILNENGETEKSIDLLKNLSENQYNSPEIFELMGNIYRYNEKFKLAETSYSNAINLNNVSEFNNQNLWLLYFFRGITLEQQKNYDKSKQDLRNSLSLSPNQPQVLNYLGYMLIEQKENLNEALDMIRKAVNISPQSGYIIDSLAWGFYQLGRYSEAIEPMERAIELEPEDPIINDHLGDVLWKIGRKREAYFQWKKALLFNPTKELKIEIQKKISFGLE